MQKGGPPLTPLLAHAGPLRGSVCGCGHIRFQAHSSLHPPALPALTPCLPCPGGNTFEQLPGGPCSFPGAAVTNHSEPEMDSRGSRGRRPQSRCGRSCAPSRGSRGGSFLPPASGGLQASLGCGCAAPASACVAMWPRLPVSPFLCCNVTPATGFRAQVGPDLGSRPLRQRQFSQPRSRSLVLGVGSRTYLFGEHHSTHGRWKDRWNCHVGKGTHITYLPRGRPTALSLCPGARSLPTCTRSGSSARPQLSLL